MAQKYSIQLLTATTAEWNASQYVVPAGELITELQTDGKIQLKIGDGLNKFSDLPYVADKGPKGDKGTPGTSPTVSTSKANGVATITIIDDFGEHSFQINDGRSPTVNTNKSGGVATVIITDDDGNHTFTINDGVSPTVETSKTGSIAMVKITDASGEHSFTIKDGDKGDPFTFADLTEAQKLELKGDTGEGFCVKGTYDTLVLLEAGVTSPSPGDAYAVGTAAPYDIYIYDGVKLTWTNHGQLKGAKGDAGAVFTPLVTENGDLSWSNNGGYANPTAVNIKGAKGDNGAVFIPSVSADGILSWTNNGEYDNPSPVNLQTAGNYRATITKSGTILTADKTFTEIKAAIDSGKLPYAYDPSNGAVFPLYSHDYESIIFSNWVINSSSRIYGVITISNENIAATQSYDFGFKPDGSMSDTSENAVQNKVIKAYVDGLIGDIDTAIASINAVIGGAT